MISTKTTSSDADGVTEIALGSATWVSLYIVVTLRKMFSVLDDLRKKLAMKMKDWGYS